MKHLRLLAVLGLVVGPAAMADTPTPYTIRISPATIAGGGRAPVVRIAVLNNTAHALAVPSARSAAIDYVVTVVDAASLVRGKSLDGAFLSSEGGEVDPSRTDAVLPGIEFSVGQTDLASGAVSDETLDLNALYTLQAGRYAVVVRRRFPIVAGDQALYSNVLEFSVK